MKKTSIINELNNGYSVQSGVFGAINDKIETKLNKYGQYEVTLDPAGMTEQELRDLGTVSAMSNSELNETVLGEKLFSKIKDIQHNPTLGYYTDLYAGYVLDGDYRAKASSGGIGTWILIQLLKKKLIDGVIHVHPVNDGSGVLFRYSVSETMQSIREGAKSRYYPVDLSEVLRVVKKTKGRYAVTGIPSFITELRLLAEYDPDFKKAIVYTVGLICGHQKSTKYVEALAWQHGIKPGNLIAVDFRKKVEGQPSSRYISEFTGKVNGKVVTITKDQNDLFVSNWGHGLFKAKFSDFSDDTFNETSDIALGDAWLPEYTGDSKGTNIIIVRNPEIASILEEGTRTGAVQLDTLAPERVIKSQSGLVHHTHDELPYRLHKQDYRGVWRPEKRFEASNDLPYIRKRVQDIREKMATLSHTKYEEAVSRDDWSYFVRSMKPYTVQYALLYRYIQLRRTPPKELVTKIIKKIRRN